MIYMVEAPLDLIHAAVAALKGMARHFAGRPYHAHEKTLPKAIQALTWDHYQAIRFRPDHALWADRPGAELWIGLHDMGTANHYRWVDGRTARVGDVDMTYTNWRGGRPEDDASQECIQLDSGSAGQWADHPCNDRLPYMCELR